MEDIKYSELAEILGDLYQRLADDYNGSKPFDQCEEDRLAVYDAKEIIAKLAEKTIDK